MGKEILESMDQAIQQDFNSHQRVLSFDEYLDFFSENIKSQCRGSAQYALEMMDFYGKSELPENPSSHSTSGNNQRFKIFDFPVEGVTTQIVGQEWVQNQIYRCLKAFSRQGFNNKLILLHGPNGSAKSSIIHSLMGGLERYSKEADGALYSFNWIFPIERYTKGSLGIHSPSSPQDPFSSFAKLSEDEIAARIPCELKDHPLLLIPQEQRKQILEELLGSKNKELLESLPHYLTHGDLCHRCKQIADAILTTAGGDFRKLLKYIQIERIYLARRYRKGLITIEPQMHVDAQYHQLTYNKNMSSLPASLQNINLFSLTGDLIEGNRGLIEYSDLLKRPIDSFKYLLTACETGSVNIGNSIAYLDSLLLGSTNEIQLDAFKEFPDFTSFKARIDLIRVPYLLSVSREKEIYTPLLTQMAHEKHVTPHVAWSVSLWSVLTRLKKPNNLNYPSHLGTLISNMGPLDKARLYDSGDLPSSLSPEDRKLLKASLKKLKEEYENIPYYEGRIGASAREIKSLLFDSAQNSEYPCLSPLAVLRELEEFVKRTSEYEFLKQEIKDGFHDVVGFIETVRNEYIQKIDQEVKDSIGIYDSAQWEDFLRKYVMQISLVLKKEKIKNPITGKREDPDFTLITEFEKIVEAPESLADRDPFRQNILSQLGAWSLDHPKEKMIYAQVFPEFWKKLEKHYFESQKALLIKMSNSLLAYDTDKDGPDSEGGQLARQTLHNMKSKFGYCQLCAQEVVIFLMRQRY